ncbi:Gfo/Idh/MocA family oxidoreductase [Ruminococcus sp.]|uniref:Gfo/Idh/MocA family protein n=1 Tax=Ruminococcus sp. TaxID=41978 RepID=UPI0025D3721C|nr:Gfo/Idh/MocA family oxidoreductase [Ruminococcus sp.]MBQ8966725.1 Gfo/Idh/MocA family oxidoreductase [Ruminococcus sp.]
MDKIRLGIIGMGNMGSGHLGYYLNGECPRIEITAFADTVPEKLKKAAEKLPSAALFNSADALIESGMVDAVLIAVPHYDHPAIAINAFEHGLHVLTEKPAGVYTSQVRRMNKAAKRSGKCFGIMFNQRTDPLFARAREIVRGGQLGDTKRLVWIVTNWYRTQAYYDSGTWRATWKGEGGGVLLNQAPHNIDLWQWIFGMPKRVRAFCSVGKYHDIGVEDDVTIYGEYDNGASSVFISTTGEAPGTNRLEISGTKGKLVLEDGKLKWWRLKEDERTICAECKDGFVQPECEYEEFTAPAPDGHPEILNDFADHILDGTPLLAPGEEGLRSLSISNAAYLSSWTDDWAEIPLAEELFEKHLAALCHDENQTKKQHRVSGPAEKLSERWKVRW